ncbi:MAG TPA: DMT family transporter [Steroidobacteraceae bacterium]|nr:DMT family transporter [Steroidobacteraceae bacterium]
MSAERKALLQIHFCVVLWGFTAILGKLISLQALDLVWWRMLIVALAVLVFPRFWRQLRSMSARQAAIFAGIGVVVALHWLSFYGAIKLSNASVAATCMAVGPIFMAFVEPWITGRSFDRRELLFGLLALPGVVLVVGGTPSGMRLGIVAGIVSVLLVAVFGSLNKRYVEQGGPLAVTGLELGAGAVFLTVVAVLWPGGAAAIQMPDARDTMLLLVLALGCTLFPYALSLVALRHINAYSAQLAVSLEPVYAILLAMLLLGEQHELTWSFYLGVAIILLVVFGHALTTRRRSAP